MKIDELIPRLAAAYHAGTLVPFLGSGMSAGTCAGWQTLVTRLEREAAEAVGEAVDADDGGTSDADLIRRVGRAKRRLDLAEPGRFPKRLGKALEEPFGEPPAQTTALAAIWWPLVVTTNYDWLFVKAFLREHQQTHNARRRSPELLVRGRAPRDSRDVLSSLSEPFPAVLWAVQGFLSDPEDQIDDQTLARVSVPPDLSAEIVLGHEEYRRATHRADDFRKAFAEVYRRRSFLFLGSGLQETYLNELFGGILELYGPNPNVHYALQEKGRLDVDFYLSRFNTVVVEYAQTKPPHEELPGILQELGRHIDRGGGRRVRAEFTLGGRSTSPAARISDHDPSADLPAPPADVSIAWGELPAASEERKVCVAVSAGGVGRRGSPSLSDHGRRAVWVTASARGESKLPPLREVAPPYLWRYEGWPLYCVVARSEGVRDLRTVFNAMERLCEAAATAEYETAHVPLLAVGRGAGIPPRLSLVQIVRAYAEWRRGAPDSRLRLVIDVLNREVLYELGIGRLDLAELVECRDIRFWAETERDGEIERVAQYWPPQSTVDEVKRALDIPEHWTLEVLPPPQLDAAPADAGWNGDLVELGVVPGSTLRFTDPAAARRQARRRRRRAPIR